MNDGKSFVPGIAYYVGDPASASVAAFDVPKGTIVLDTTNGVVYLKTAAQGTNSAGYSTLLSNTGTQTLTNKTLTTPTINTPTISGGTRTLQTDTGNIAGDIKVQAASQTIDNSSTLAALSTAAIWTVVAGATYVFDFDFPVTCTTTGGVAVGFTLATATLTSIRYNYELHSAADKTDAIGGTGTTATSGTKMVADKSVAWTRVRVQGSFVVNAGGTFSFTVSQETAATGGDASLFLIGGTSRLARVA